MTYKLDKLRAVQEIMSEEDKRLLEALEAPHCLKCFSMYKIIRTGNTKIYQHSQEDCDTAVSQLVVDS